MHGKENNHYHTHISIRGEYNHIRQQHSGLYGNGRLLIYVDGIDAYFNLLVIGQGMDANIGHGGMTSAQKACSDD
jgi:hypothetical protein